MAGNLIVDRKTATFEDFGDEIVVIHNDSGVFYSLKGRAMGVWRALLQGLDTAAVDARLRASAPAEADVIQAMLAELTTRGIAVATDSASAVIATICLEDLGPARFESNGDFDDLIRLDPIHDVSDEGWPHRKTAPK